MSEQDDADPISDAQLGEIRARAEAGAPTSADVLALIAEIQRLRDALDAAAIEYAEALDCMQDALDERDG